MWPISSATQILLPAFDLGLAPREGTTAQKIVAQEISKPE